MSKAAASGNLLRRFPFASVCVGVAVGLAAFYFFRQGALDEARVEVERLDGEGRKIERNVRNAASIEEHLAAMKAGVGQLETKLAKVDDVSGNQEYFYGLETGSGVRVSVLRPLGVPKGTVAGQAYQPAGFNVVVEGDYGQIIAFLRALENGSRLYRLVDFAVQRSSGGPESASKAREVLTINLQLLASK